MIVQQIVCDIGAILKNIAQNRKTVAIDSTIFILVHEVHHSAYGAFRKTYLLIIIVKIVTNDKSGILLLLDGSTNIQVGEKRFYRSHFSSHKLFFF